jgi:hypothetical protein
MPDFNKLKTVEMKKRRCVLRNFAFCLPEALMQGG